MSSAVVKAGDVADGEIIGIPLGTATLDNTAPVTPEQSAPIIAVTPWLTRPSAAEVAAAESIQVESARITLIVEPFKSFPEFEASENANSAPAAISGVRDSIGPVNPRIIPTLTVFAWEVLKAKKVNKVAMILIIFSS